MGENNYKVVLVEASKLSLDDKFMRHKPKTKNERELKRQLKEVIANKPYDFYKVKYDPSFLGASRSEISFEKKKRPATGKTYSWWESVAKLLCHERRSRLGTKSEYIAFLGVLLKILVDEEGWSMTKAWNAVCNDSHEIGHYWDTENEKHGLIKTGSRGIRGFFDLANTYKILLDDAVENDGFWLAGGGYGSSGVEYPIATFTYTHIRDCISYCGVGWIIFEE